MIQPVTIRYGLNHACLCSAYKCVVFRKYLVPYRAYLAGDSTNIWQQHGKPNMAVMSTKCTCNSRGFGQIVLKISRGSSKLGQICTDFEATLRKSARNIGIDH